MGELPAQRSDSRAFTTRDFRDTLARFATGVTVVTTRGQDHSYGMTANAFSSVSLDPPLVLVCISLSAAGHEMIRRNGVFAVNILGVDQEPLSRFFASKDRPRGRDAFLGIPHREALTGAPILDGVAGFIDCQVHAVHEVGDHLIFIGEARALGYDPEVTPLVFHAGSYAALPPRA